jgi:hypothetical protein
LECDLKNADRLHASETGADGWFEIGFVMPPFLPARRVIGD